VGVEPLGGIGAVRVVVRQISDVDGPFDAQIVGHFLPALTHLRAALFVMMPNGLDGDATARRAELTDLFEEPILGLRR
jgi:hypothetical protein